MMVLMVVHLSVKKFHKRQLTRYIQKHYFPGKLSGRKDPVLNRLPVNFTKIYFQIEEIYLAANHVFYGYFLSIVFIDEEFSEKEWSPFFFVILASLLEYEIVKPHLKYDPVEELTNRKSHLERQVT